MRICAFLIIAFVIRFLKSILSKLDTGEIAGFLIVSVAEETGLNLALLKTPGTGFSRQDQFFTRWIKIFIDFSFNVKAVILIFISGRGLAFSSAKEGKSGFIYNLVKS